MKIGFLNLLTLVFIIAKLFGATTWPWGVVFIPTYISAFLWVVFFVVAILAAMSENK